MLKGWLDRVDRLRISGWARDDEHSERPVAVLITCDGELLGRVIANRLRPDLAKALGTSGRHAYELWLPRGGLSSLTRHTIRATHEADGSELIGSPVVIEAADAFDKTVEDSLSTLLDGAATEDDLIGRIEFLVGRVEHLTQRLSDGRSRRSWRAYCQSGFRSPDPDLPDPPPRALVIDDRIPDARRDAGSAAILSHIASLQRLGFVVAFIPSDLRVRGEPGLPALTEMGVHCYGPPLYRSVEEVIRREAGSFDLVYLHRLSNASRYSPLMRQHCSNARLVYGVADLHHVRLIRQGLVEGRIELLSSAGAVRMQEYLTAWAAHCVITHSTAEARQLREAIPGLQVEVVPWSVAPRPTLVPLARRHGIAFIGGFVHPPNADAARWLVREIMPLVWREAPDIECLLVGRDLPDDFNEIFTRGVIPVGPVDDLATIFDRVRVTVAPLAFGAGIKGKVLDSLAAGVPCVCTPIAAEGMELPSEFDDFIATDAAGLARAILALHDDTARNASAAATGLAWIGERFTEAAVDAAMRRVVGADGMHKRRIRLPASD